VLVELPNQFHKSFLRVFLHIAWFGILSSTGLVFAQDVAPLEPLERKPEKNEKDGGMAKETPDAVQSAMLDSVSSIDSLSDARKARTAAPAVDAVNGKEAQLRITSDLGNLIGKSQSVRGVSSQQRTPIVTDTRIRGQRVGQVLAAGSFWAPVRLDLDTMMNKIDSRLIDSLIIIKGPYSPRYGPGFSFVDIDMLATPRYEDGPQSHGTSSADFQSNGGQWYGRQTFYGGSEDWGYRVSYGHRGGSDYTTGDGETEASGYNSGDLNVALGKNFSPDDRLEFNLLRLDQRDLEFPGLYYDIRRLKTEGYEIKYTGTDPSFCDRILSEVWYNRTGFSGDTFSPSKQADIPLDPGIPGPDGIELTDGNAITDGNGQSLGYRSEFIFGELGFDHWSLGNDLNIQRQALNDIELSLPSNDNNFPLAPSKSVDVGFFVERVKEQNDWLRTNFGARLDTINANAEDIVPGLEDPLSDIKDADLNQNFLLWSTYGTAEITLTENWLLSSGLGYSQRPPTLTEMYVDGAFIGTLQRGLTFLDGDPELRPERLKQIDLGITGNYERFQGGFNAYQAWIRDFITYDLYTEANPDGGLPQGADFVNTDRAILRGIDSFGKYDLLEQLSLIGTLSYTQGEDLTRETPGRLSGNTTRSNVSGVPREALPGIAPFDSRVGIVLHDSAPVRRWGVEISARMVASQNRVAASLQELESDGFALGDIRAYRVLRNRALLTCGVENFTNTFYREHLDFRTGDDVFRPGVNFYSGLQLQY
jgi:iron complex outermembrane receptor protein